MEQNYTKGKNIAKLLKYAPTGTMLYSPLIGSCTLVRVSDDEIVVSNLEDTQHYGFDWCGRYWTGMGECLLYPSQDHKSWDGWQNELFGKGDIVVREGVGTYIIVNGFDGVDMYDYILIDKDGTRYANVMCDGTPLFTECRYASPQEARAFMTVLERKGYRWDEQRREMVLGEPKGGEAPNTKHGIVAGRWYVSLRTQYYGDDYVAFHSGKAYRCNADGYLVDEHGYPLPVGSETDEYFRPAEDGEIPVKKESVKTSEATEEKSFTELKPFDRVLVRDSEGAEWDASIFKHYDKDDAIYRYRCMDSGWAMCIPYNDETRKLLGTRDNCDKKYITWKI
jgi:hypothetical protein